MRYLLVFLLLANCTLLNRERGYPGGNAGYVADKYLLFAKGHDQRVSRYLISLTLIAPMMAETAESPSEARLSALRINDMYRGLTALHNAAIKCPFDEKYSEKKVGKTQSCDLTLKKTDDDSNLTKESAFAFETLSFDVSRSLFHAVKQIADNLNIKSSAKRLVKLSPIELAKSFLRSLKAIPKVVKYFATYRDISIILGDSVYASCEGKECDRIRKAFTDNTVRTLSTNETDIVPILNILNVSLESINEGKNWELQSDHYHALVFHVDRACKVLLKIQEQEFKGDDVTNCGTGGTGRTGGTKSVAEAFLISNTTP